MPRPRLLRSVKFFPRVKYFKPQGIPLKELEIVELTHEEVEAYRLRYIKNKQQEEAAQIMKTSQSTYQRILTRAHEKIADAIINGKAISIIKDED